MWLIIVLVVIILITVLIIKRSYKFRFDSILLLLGCVGAGKTSTAVYILNYSIKKAQGIWKRRTKFYSKIFKKMKDEEQPLIYSTLPIYEDRKKGVLHPLYRPLTSEHLLRKRRFNFKSIVFIDEVSLLACSRDANNEKVSEYLHLWVKLIRQEMHGAYRNLLGTYPNVILTTQSKDDSHYAFDRSINNVVYILKSLNIPFFRIVWVRDLLLIDSVVNNFNDSVKDDDSLRWYLVPTKIFNKYNSYALSFLTDNKPTDNREPVVMDDGRFELASFHEWKEFIKSNEKLDKAIEEMKKELIELERKEEEKKNG